MPKDSNGVITYTLNISPIKQGDQLTVYLRDYAGNEKDGIKVNIEAVPFTYSMKDAEAKEPDMQEGLYLTEENNYSITISSEAPDIEVEVAAVKKDGTDRKTLATMKDGEEYILNAAAIKEAYGTELPATQEFDLILHRVDIENEQSDQILPFIYDTECTLTIGSLEQQQNKVDNLTAVPWGEMGATVTGTTGLDGKSVQAFVYSDLQREPSDETEEIPVGPEGQFSIDVKLNSGSRFIKVVAKDKAKNSAEYVIKVQPSKALPIILMVAGAILMAVSLFIFFGTQKQIRQLEEINRAKTATVQEKKKR